MKVLNTKILLEYLVDESEHSKDADLFFDSASESEVYFLNNVVLHEVIRSFEDNVKFDKCDILTALQALVSNSQIRFEDRQIVVQAIKTYRIGKSQFSDCLKDSINERFIQDQKNFHGMDIGRKKVFA